MKENKQHVQLPNEMGLNDLEPKDQLIYLCIHKHINPKTKIAEVSLAKIRDLSGASISTIQKSINHLIEKKYITVDKTDKCCKYTFTKYTNYEVFGLDFLEKKDISFTSKAYLCASQQYMFKDVEGCGKISYSNQELAKQINLPDYTISRCNSELKRKGYLSILKNATKDIETGCNTETKVFNLVQLGQAVIWTLKKHDEDIESIKEQLAETNKLVAALQKQLAEQEINKQQNFTM